MDFQTTNPEIAYAEALVMAQDPADPLVYVNHGTIGHGIIAPGQHKVVWPGQVLAIAASPSDVPVSVNPWSFTAERRHDRQPVPGRRTDRCATRAGKSWRWGCWSTTTTRPPSSSFTTPPGGFNVLSLRTLTQTGMQLTFIPTLDLFDGHLEQFTTRRGTVALVVPAAGKLAFRPIAVGAGSYMVGVFVVDVWGKADGDFHTIRLTAPLPP